MIIGARQIFTGKRLPYDAEVEYLESTGSDTYILVPIDWRELTRVEVTWQRVDRNTMYILGARAVNINVYQEALYQGRNNDNLSNIQFYISRSIVGLPWISGENVQMRVETAVIDLQTNTLSADGNVKDFPAYQHYNNPIMALFGIVTSAGTEMYYSSPGRIMSFKAESANGMVRGLQPVRFTNELGVSEGAMYDKVSKQLFRNQGTGDFVIGPDKN